MPNKSKMPRKAAYEAIQEKIKKKRAGIGDIILQTIIDDFVESRRSFVKESTLAGYQVVINKIYSHISPYAIVNNIKPGDIQTILKDITLSISRDYGKKIRVLHHGAWYIGYMNGKVASMDPIDRTAFPKIQQMAKKVREHEEKFLSTNKLNDVLSLIRKDYPFLADIFDFQARAGLRFGELAALREEDYDGNNIDVNATLCWTGRRKGAHRGTPKNAYKC
ncbi:MAG: hypothetical protein SOU94_00660 [Acidaminococcus sp.]|uniref:Tyr recombinase domain-containing protein n=1 Tax=Acidaminococcus intestini TaxID=187327 RepID=A0A943EDD0_9FIRM|nr:hypothetical protein [Acidaminococcus sp.]MBS5520137.1 hypothetical protein [Acidaminococcus intestini]MDY2738327.1 hypothetical protein [Acidaminococcus sp.]